MTNHDNAFKQRCRTPNTDPTIYYIVTYGEGADTQQLSPFRGHHIVDLCSASFQFAATHSPSSIRELFETSERRFLLRAYGRKSNNIALLSLPDLGTFIDVINPQFLVVYFDPTFTDHLDALERRLGWPILRIARDTRGFETIRPTSFMRPGWFDLIIDYFVDILALIRIKDPDNPLCALGDYGNNPPFWHSLDSESKRCFFHNATHPNDALFFLAGYQIDLSHKPDYLRPDSVIIECIADQATEILATRNRFRQQEGLRSAFQNNLILFFPHYFLELFLGNEGREKWIKSRKRREQVFRSLQASDLVKSVKEVAPHTDADPFERSEMRNFIGILWFQHQFNFSVPVLPGIADPMESVEGRSYMEIQAAETAASTVGATMLAANNSAPVLRWSPSLRSSFDALFKFVDLYRKSSYAIPQGPVFKDIPLRDPDQDAIACAFNVFVERAQALTPQRYLDLISSSGAIKLFTDFPFEWLRVKTLPISYTTETSRVPHTPAKTAMELIRRSSRHIEITLADVQTIRVLTFFGRGDKLRGRFSNDLLTFFKHTEVPIKLEEIEVRRPREFVEALVDTPGKVVIIDMHGAIERDGLGVLRLKRKGFSSIDFEVEVEYLMQQRKAFVSAPPIVILSACDTFSPTSQGFSIAVSLLRAGATTVLGTLLPIDAYRSAALISKILMETHGFLTNEIDKAITWRNMVCDQFKYAAAVDWFGSCQQAFNRIFDEAPSYFEAVRSAYESRVGNLLGAEDRLIASLSAIFGEDETRIRDVLITQAPYIDPMNYVQLGFPERITLSGPSSLGTEIRLPTEIDLLEQGYWNTGFRN